VAPEKIENIVSHCPLIAQCFVHGDSLQSYLVAIVVPDEDPVRAWAARCTNGDSPSQSLATQSMEQLCRNDQLHQEILRQIQEVSMSARLQGFETVRAIYLEPNPFTVENDLITPTFKLRREKLRDCYAAQITELYGSNPHSRL
jgi:long-chain acyl-CoA synthetase